MKLETVCITVSDEEADGCTASEGSSSGADSFRSDASSASSSRCVFRRLHVQAQLAYLFT